MLKKKDCICIIPARGGSKRIKNKNIKNFFGKPIIYYSINSAIKSQCFNEIVVTTDSVKIAKIAEKYGAKVPFLRPKNLSDDNTPLAPVISHTISELKKIKILSKKVCVITATAPLLNYKHLQNSKEIFDKNKPNFLVSLNKFSYPVQRALRMNNRKKIAMIDKKQNKSRSQDLEPIYHDAGQFYWGTTKSFKKNANILSDNSMGYLIESYESVDIDTMEDWKMAKIIFKLNNYK